MSDGTRVGHCKQDKTHEYIGRGTGSRDMHETPVGQRGWLGNPYTLDDYSREESIKLFRQDFEDRLTRDAEFRDAVRDLAGCVLLCWCQEYGADAPACHAEVIAEHADRLAGEEPSPHYPRRVDSWVQGRASRRADSRGAAYAAEPRDTSAADGGPVVRVSRPEPYQVSRWLARVTVPDEDGRREPLYEGPSEAGAWRAARSWMREHPPETLADGADCGGQTTLGGF